MNSSRNSSFHSERIRENKKVRKRFKSLVKTNRQQQHNMRTILFISLALYLFFGGFAAASLTDPLDVAILLKENNNVDLLFDLHPVDTLRGNGSVNDFLPVPAYPTFHPGRQFEPDVFNMNCAFAEFVFCCMVAAIPTALLRKKFNSNLETAIFWWFAFDGLIHLGMEGSFVLISLENRFIGGAAVSDRHYLMTCVCKYPFWTNWSFSAESESDRIYSLGTEYGKADYRWLYGDQNIVGFEL